VFVGGLDYSMRDIELKEHFEQYGKIKDYQIIRDPVSRSSRGFGFVKFFDESIALKLITQLQVITIKGRRVDMRTADLKTPDRIHDRIPDKI
jgi:RNA recognition motif-containing protein